jgi:single-strand DNA-binding protein
MSRSVNKVILIGNLTRDPEVRYTPQGNAVASFGLATNREWTINGEKKEVVDFHNLVAWNKLGELCGQLLSKGSKIYVEGRLQTRDWVTEDGTKRYKTEVVVDEMIVLSSRRSTGNDFQDMDDAGQGAEAPQTGDSLDDIDNIDLDKVLSDEGFDTASEDK